MKKILALLLLMFVADSGIWARTDADRAAATYYFVKKSGIYYAIWGVNSGGGSTSYYAMVTNHFFRVSNGYHYADGKKAHTNMTEGTVYSTGGYDGNNVRFTKTSGEMLNTGDEQNTYFGNVVIPESITVSIGGRSRTVTVLEIGACAFRGCSDSQEWNSEHYTDPLTGVTIPNTVNFIGNYAFFGYKKKGLEIEIPSSVTDMGRNPFAYTSTADLSETAVTVTVNSGNTTYDCKDNCVYTKLSSGKIKIAAVCGNFVWPTATSVPGLTEIEIGERSMAYCIPRAELEIPELVKVLGMESFVGSVTLESVTIPNTITSMGEGVFRVCQKLDNVVIPSCITALPASTFYECYSLKNVTFEGALTSIGKQAFYRCDALTDFTLPRTLTTIDQLAFQRSGLKALHIPGNMTASSVSVGNYAFSGSYLADIYFYGTPTESPTFSGTTAFSIANTSDQSYHNYTGKTGITLHVPAHFLYSYKSLSSSSFWGASNFKGLQGVLTDMDKNRTPLWETSSTTIPSGWTYTTNNVSSVGMRYIRSFSGTGWQALCLPFAFAYDDVKDNFEVATLRSTQNSKGYLQFDIRSNGDVAAHTPCLIRAKAAGDSQNLDASSTTLEKASSLSPVTLNLFVAVEGVANPDPCKAEDWEKQDCPISGLYAPATEVTNGWAMSGGVIKRVGSSASVPAFRWILTTPGGRLVRELTISEDDGTETRLDALTLEPVATGNGALYNLKGQRVVAPHHGEIYIRNGRKVIY